MTGHELSVWETETILLMLKEYQDYKPVAENPAELSPLLSDEERIKFNHMMLQEHIKSLTKGKKNG